MGLTKEQITSSELGIGLISAIVPVTVLGLLRRFWFDPTSGMNNELLASIFLFVIGLLLVLTSHKKLITEIEKHLIK
jgi:hypothetical protein